jgi:hypothetical protein
MFYFTSNQQDTKWWTYRSWYSPFISRFQRLQREVPCSNTHVRWQFIFDLEADQYCVFVFSFWAKVSTYLGTVLGMQIWNDSVTFSKLWKVTTQCPEVEVTTIKGVACLKLIDSCTQLLLFCNSHGSYQLFDHWSTSNGTVFGPWTTVLFPNPQWERSCFMRINGERTWRLYSTSVYWVLYIRSVFFTPSQLRHVFTSYLLFAVLPMHGDVEILVLVRRMMLIVAPVHVHCTYVAVLHRPCPSMPLMGDVRRLSAGSIRINVTVNFLFPTTVRPVPIECARRSGAMVWRMRQNCAKIAFLSKRQKNLWRNR